MQLLELLENYLFDLSIGAYSPNTIKLYEHTIKNFVDFLPEDNFSDTQLVQILKKYILLQKQKQLATNTIATKVKIINKFLKEYMNLDTKIKPKMLRNVLPKALNNKEINALLTYYKGSSYDINSVLPDEVLIQISHRNRLIIHTLYYTGCRVNELRMMKKTHINFNDNTILIKGKGNKERFVLFNQELKIMFLNYFEFIPNQEYIFTAYDKTTPLSSRVIEKVIKTTATKVGINKKVTPHTLRHTFATHLLQNGVDIRLIQQLLGHEQLDTTKIYTYLDLKDIKNMIEKHK